MKSAFAGHPAWAAIVLFSVVFWVVIEIRQSLNRRSEATPSDRGSLLILRLAPIPGAVAAGLVARVTATAFDYNAAAFALTLTLMWAGLGLRWWSFQTLGHYFTFTVMTSPDQPVITTGPYRVLRHPSYLGILLIIIGLTLMWSNWLSIVVLLIPVLLAFINRIRVEEAALTETLGAAYTDYAGGRKRLVPFLW